MQHSNTLFSCTEENECSCVVLCMDKVINTTASISTLNPLSYLVIPWVFPCFPFACPSISPRLFLVCHLSSYLSLLYYIPYPSLANSSSVLHPSSPSLCIPPFYLPRQSDSGHLSSGPSPSGLKLRVFRLEQVLREKEEEVRRLRADTRTTKLQEMRLQVQVYYREVGDGGEVGSIQIVF